MTISDLLDKLSYWKECYSEKEDNNIYSKISNKHVRFDEAVDEFVESIIDITIDNEAKDHFNICKELNDLYSRKNHDYGDSFHRTFEEEGYAMCRIRMADKLNRFKTLSRGEVAEVNDESLEDTAMDLANYAIMTVMEMRRKKNV